MSSFEYLNDPLLDYTFLQSTRVDVERHLPDIHSYADGSQIYLAFRPYNNLELS